jgi:hypothetical protein
MPKDFSRLTIGMPDFGDREQFLKTLGTIVADEIVAMIDREEKPDGSPQKQNSPAYADAKRKYKGYTTPLKGISKISPYLARRATFKREIFNTFGAHGGTDIALEIRLNQKRAEIGKKLTDKGYWFMGITRQAELGIRQRADRYFKNKIRQLKKGT